MKKGLDLTRISPSLLMLKAYEKKSNEITCCEVCRNKTLFCCFCKWRKSLFIELEKEREAFLE